MNTMDEKKDINKARGGRLARRAKSFKEDFLGKINQMRSQSGTRCGSPNKVSKSKLKTIGPELIQEKSNTNKSMRDMDSILHSTRLLSSALRYYQDVIQKDKLEMLPGSVNVVLETIIMIHSALRNALVDDQSSVMLSATNQVYQSLASLIRWSDCVLLHGDQSVQKEDVLNMVQALQDAIKTLVQLSIDKLQNKESKSSTCINSQNGVHSSKPESPHRNSLPDIPLTPREIEILEKTQFPGAPYFCQTQMQHSASSDSILGNSLRIDSCTPPPKPPLPEFHEISHLQSSPECPENGDEYHHLDCAPPLPPKKRPGISQSQFDYISQSSDSILFDQNCSLLNTDFSCHHFIERTSPFSQSPENSTPLSKSSASSLDSNLDSADDLLSCHHKTSPLSIFESNSRQTFLSSLSQTYSCELTSCTTTQSKTSLTLKSQESLDDVNSILQQINKVTTSSERVISSVVSVNSSEPPALPLKLRSAKNRTISQYDNVPQLVVSGMDEKADLSETHSNQFFSQTLDSANWFANKHEPTCPHHKLTDNNSETRQPPPLPPKKKTIMAYMQMFGSYSQPSETEFLRHSLHTYSVVQASWQQLELSFMPVFHNTASRSLRNSGDAFFHHGIPPALPPKKSRGNSQRALHLPPSQSLTTSIENICSSSHSPTISDSEEKERNLPNICDENAVLKVTDIGALEEQDVSHYIIFKKPGEEGPEIRAGTVDSLIVQATKADKNDFLYQEAFLTTYRTFITPLDLVKKLLYRYNKFIHMSDMRQRAARNAFSLLVRVVNDMCVADLQVEILTVLMDFIYQLVGHGELLLARALHTKVVEKCEARQKYHMSAPVLLPSMAISTHQSSLLNFKSECLAEQMTLLDADLFQKIEIPEVLLWAKEQKEELSPNLTKFTEHFNKMSYWARSRILEQEEAKDREKYVVKFIKIMKHLRKLNNFNSYLAILSALDSAPIRRLEWQRNITEGLKEYCALIDSSSSFRAYRQALAETTPPCIPYIGLILQDLTFVHIGNNDWYAEESVNFSKRWQQFNILDNMRRFKNSQYPFRRNDNVIAFFSNFDDYLCEEAMWQISETIKPRGGKKKTNEQL